MLSAGKNTVEILIAARDRTQAAFAKVNTRMKTMGGASNKLSSSMGSLGSKMSSLATSINPIAIAAGAAALAFATMGGAAMKASLEFEKAFATIRVGTGATGESLAGLEESFKTVFTSVPTSTADAATAIADLNTRLGLTGEPLEALATQFLNLSRITGTDVSSAISSATRVMHDFAVSSEEQSTALDYLFKVSQSTGIGMTQLSSSMTQYGSVMRQMGFDINESAALLGKFEKEGVNLQLVLGSLRMGLANFAKAGEEPVEALQRVITEIQGMGSVADANLKAIEIFGSRAGPDMAAAIREGRFSIDELMSTLDASTETINKAAADTLTFGDKWTLAKNKIMEAIVPIGDVITGVLGNAIEGVSASFNTLQAIIKPLMAIFKGFFDAIDAAVSSALAPLVTKLKELHDKFKEGTGKLTIFSDIITIAAAGAKFLGEKIGILLKMALIPLVDKLKDAIDMLTAFYDKLGPIKDLIEGVKGAIGGAGKWIHDFAEAVDDTETPIEKLKEGLKNIKKEAPKAANAIVEIEEAVEEADKKMNSFKVTIGDTTIEFKDQAAGVVKNAEAYEKLQKSAQMLMDLDWSVFTEFEASLPRIESGLGDMESSFVGLKDVLEDNIDKLESIQEAIIRINEIGAPFIDKGFLKGVEAIGKFAGALKTASGAINDFSSLQDISIDGCINFSLHVRDMVSALELLEGQMEDIVPDFAQMDSLITDIADAFLYGDDKLAVFVDAFDSAVNRSKGILDSGAENFNEFREIVDKAMSAGELTFMREYVKEGGTIFKDWTTIAVESAEDVRQAMLHPYGPGIMSEFETTVGTITSGTDEIRDTYTEATVSLHNWVLENYGLKISQAELYAVMESPPEEQRKWFDDLAHSNAALTFQMDKQTNALKDQTGQLAKITDALQPYLEFMRTLNELAALSTLSTDDLNSGLNAINDTLINLGKSLETFDLRPAMESLFGAKIDEGVFAGGMATGFTDTMKDFASPFSDLITYVERLTSSIFSLVSSFEALAKISDSVLADQTKIKEVFEGITDVMSNFSVEMGGANRFAQKFADGMDAMLTSAAPLIDYFQKNNAAIEQFNKSLNLFVTTITGVVRGIQDLSKSIESVTDMVVVSAEDMDVALALIPEQLGEIASFLEGDIWGDIVEGLTAVDSGYTAYAKTVEDSMITFNSAMETFSSLISKILGLSSSLKEMRDMSVLSVRDIDEALKNIPVFLDRFVDALALNMDSIKRSLKDLNIEWSKHAEEMETTMPAYEDATDKIGKLIGSLLSLNSALKQLAEMGTISGAEFDRGFASLMGTISNFAVSLSKNVDGLIESLVHLDRVWIANQGTLVPLMRDFMIITTNFYEIANNANAMAESFRDLQKNSGTLEGGFKSLIDFINQVVKSTKEFYTPEAAAELARYITDVGKVIQAFVNLERELENAMGAVKNAVTRAVNNIERKISSLDNLVRDAFYWGANMMIGFVNGIYSMEEDLKLAAQRMASIVAWYLGASSNTKLGPLSHLEEWGPNVVKTYAAGMAKNMHLLDSSFAALAPGMGAGTASGRGGSITLYNNQYITDRDSADYANEGLQRMLQRHSVM